MRIGRASAVLVLMLVGGLAWGWESVPEDEIPALGRPVEVPFTTGTFSEASGNFRVEARAEPTRLVAQQTLTLTLTVHARGRTRRPPRRIDLSKLPAFRQNFFIEDGPSPKPPGKDAGVWKFVYRLRPRNAAVAEIPEIPYGFYNPDIRPTSQGFQATFTDPIPLEVTARPEVVLPLLAPPEAFALMRGPAVLAPWQPWSPPAWQEVVLLLLAPPVAGLAWYLLWRRLYPSAARLARHRRSRAAQVALRALVAAEHSPPAEQAECVVKALTGYLHSRTDLPLGEPTPNEVIAHLAARNLPATELADLLRECETARFRARAPGKRSPELGGLARQAQVIVENLETASRPAVPTSALSAVLLAFVFWALAGPALASPTLLEQAEKEFDEGVRLKSDAARARPHFAAAARHYEALIVEAGPHCGPPLYYNLGNARLLAGDLPAAILAYHRGLRLAPDDPDLRAALTRARGEVVYPDPGPFGRPVEEVRPPWLPALNPAWLLRLSAGFYALAWLLGVRWWMVRGAGLLVVAAVALLLALGLGGALIALVARETAPPLVVVATSGLKLRSGDGTGYPARNSTPLNRGVEARLLFERKHWLQVELSSGEVGWFPRRGALVEQLP